MCCLVLQQPTILILDEPTNHINFRHLKALATAIKKFEGKFGYLRTYVRAYLLSYMQCYIFFFHFDNIDMIFIYFLRLKFFTIVSSNTFFYFMKTTIDIFCLS